MRKFSPWRRDFKYGWGLVALAVFSFIFFKPGVEDYELIFLCSVPVLLGLRLIKRGYYRIRGKIVEESSLSDVKLPHGWSMRKSVGSRFGGDIDAVVTKPNGSVFAIEIKSYSGVVARRSWWIFGPVRLYYRSGSRVSGDPVGQAMRNAQSAGGKAVIWLPRDTSRPRVTRFLSLIVVHGGERQLRRALGYGWF